MEKATVESARLVEEEERQAEIERQRWEAQQEQWRREEAARRAAKALKDSKFAFYVLDLQANVIVAASTPLYVSFLCIIVCL